MVTDEFKPVLLSLERVRVQFNALVAVQDLSFDLKAGDLLGLIGPNGAGKTTLLRAIAGLQPLTSGRVRVMDEAVVPQNRWFRRHVGFTPDTPAVYEDLTVREFLYFVGMGYGLPQSEINSRIDFWLEQVWLSGKVNEKIKTLSRGMRQRIGIEGYTDNAPTYGGATASPHQLTSAQTSALLDLLAVILQRAEGSIKSGPGVLVQIVANLIERRLVGFLARSVDLWRPPTSGDQQQHCPTYDQLRAKHEKLLNDALGRCTPAAGGRSPGSPTGRLRAPPEPDHDLAGDACQ